MLRKRAKQCVNRLSPRNSREGSSGYVQCAPFCLGKEVVVHTMNGQNFGHQFNPPSVPT